LSAGSTSLSNPATPRTAIAAKAHWAHPAEIKRQFGDMVEADLGRLLGSRQRASDILTRKRPLTMRMAWRLHREWGIPAEALIAPPQTRGRKSAA
jgi:plasmid maintenance system antidote protein VapI